MQQRSPISIYPPNADSWAHSGWDEDYPQLDQETPPPPTTANTGANTVAGTVASTVAGTVASTVADEHRRKPSIVQRASRWWTTMTSLQLRGFIVAMTILVGISTVSVIANYWILHANGQSPIEQRALTSDDTNGDTHFDGMSSFTPSTITLTTTVNAGTDTGTDTGLSSGGKKVTGGAPGVSSGGLVNINTASLTQLEELPGVGPATAQSIVEYRTANGAFSSVEELTAVNGIGQGKLAKIRGHATV